ncbi:MAG: phosphoglycerate mutase (2,3-diphosphoglycerate-independent), partial [Deltaproteobacteria bacterium]|nr:phosphoglycerate mutase (2,3-diphosphoglycerate-independent) [Deltaproteobacteria bacterium]
LRSGGDLTDVAPSILQLLGLSCPAQMTGRSLLKGQPRPGRVVLLILDGWGLRREEFGNLILKAATPHMDRLMAERPWTELAASGPRLGMPQGTVGNSEVGHLHLGAGRRVDSDRVRINKAIDSGQFFGNPALVGLVDKAKKEKRPLHLLGIASFYSSHGSLDHLFALMETARRQGLNQVFVQAMLGRRGEKANSGPKYLSLIEKTLAEKGQGPIASVIGRHWSLDREENWDRIEKTFNLYFKGQGRPVK